jgi:hypothetical protein
MDIKTVKMVVGTVAGAGAYRIISTIARNNVAATGPISTITIFVGSIALAMLAAEKVNRHTDYVIDQIYRLSSEGSHVIHVG